MWDGSSLPWIANACQDRSMTVCPVLRGRRVWSLIGCEPQLRFARTENGWQVPAPAVIQRGQVSDGSQSFAVAQDIGSSPSD